MPGMVEVKACGPSDPDGSRAAAILSVYFEAEHTRALRRQLCYRLAIVFVVWGIFAAFLRSESAFVADVLVIGAAVSYAMFIEWCRAAQLKKLIKDQQV